MIKKYRFEALEALRGYMAWWVVLGHALQTAGFLKPDQFVSFLALKVDFSQQLVSKFTAFLLSGGSAVNVFIMLSGFVITHLLVLKRENYRDFILRRFFRLAPVLYFCLFFAILLVNFYELSLSLPFSSLNPVIAPRIVEQNSHFWEHLVSHLTFLYGMIPNEVLPYASRTFVGPAWSVGLEWQFYLLAPLLIPYILKSRKAILIVVFFVFLSKAIIYRQEFFSWEHHSIILMVPDYFMVGILSRVLLDRLSSGSGFLEILLLLFILLLRQDIYSTLIWLGALFVILVETNFINIKSDFLDKVLSILFYNKCIKSLGTWSYSTYLVHVPVFSLFVGSYAYLKGVSNVNQNEVLLH